MMSAYFNYNTNLTSYDLCVSDLKTAWKKQDAIAYANKIVEELKEAGFVATALSSPSNLNFYFQNLKKGELSVDVSSCETSKVATLDAWGVEISVERK